MVTNYKSPKSDFRKLKIIVQNRQVSISNPNGVESISTMDSPRGKSWPAANGKYF